jgi:hypothetical protein
MQPLSAQFSLILRVNHTDNAGCSCGVVIPQHRRVVSIAYNLKPDAIWKIHGHVPKEVMGVNLFDPDTILETQVVVTKGASIDNGRGGDDPAEAILQIVYGRVFA